MLPNPTPDDKVVIQMLKDHASGKKTSHKRGAFLDLMALTECENDERMCFACCVTCTDTLDSIVLIVLATQSRPFNLQKEGLYKHVLDYLRLAWSQYANMVPSTTSTREGEPFMASDVRAYDHVTVSNLRYGVHGTSRGHGYCYGYVYNRHAVRIVKILNIVHRRADSQLPPLEEQCAIVEPFIASNVEDAMPWAGR